MPLKPHPTDPDKMVFVKAEYNLPPNERTLSKIRQAAWNAVHKDYKDDPECCFALGFDAGYGAVALRVEPPEMESGAGFESLPAPPKKEWVGLTIEERTDIRRRIQEYTPMDDIKYGEAVQFFTEEALKEKNT